MNLVIAVVHHALMLGCLLQGRNELVIERGSLVHEIQAMMPNLMEEVYPVDEETRERFATSESVALFFIPTTLFLVDSQDMRFGVALVYDDITYYLTCDNIFETRYIAPSTTVRDILTYDPDFQTERGLGVGSTFDELKKVYGDLEPELHPYISRSVSVDGITFYFPASRSENIHDDETVEFISLHVLEVESTGSEEN